MSDSKLEVKACPWCQQQPIKRTDSYIPDAVACPNGHTAPMRLSEWNNRPIANNGVSLSFNEKELTKIGYDAVRDYSWEVSGLDALNFPICNVCELHKVVKIVVKGILAKLQPTAPVTASR